jgi:hypothetical protein
VAGAERSVVYRQPLHCGYANGYRPSGEYSGGLRLGTALAISGAAASPNQGYNSSSLVTFLMTLFNVRLGWWLGNSARPDSFAWKRKGPRHAAMPLFIEALGLTNENRAFLNLSDGGHFENLGIYEMLRRRCRYIVVIDAEHDGATLSMGWVASFARRGSTWYPDSISEAKTGRHQEDANQCWQLFRAGRDRLQESGRRGREWPAALHQTGTARRRTGRCAALLEVE